MGGMGEGGSERKNVEVGTSRTHARDSSGVWEDYGAQMRSQSVEMCVCVDNLE